MTTLLEGSIAVVTGGAAGIGGGISRRFAAEGATVVLNDIDAGLLAAAVADIEAIGARAVGVHGDIREQATVDRLADAALAVDGGRVDVLVNNVGDYRPNGRFLKTGPDDWRALYDINLGHVLACTRAIAPAMVERRSGSIVNVSTVEAFRGIPNQVVYSAFKAGVTQFTKSLALDLGNDGVRVNAIAPDLTETIQVPYSAWVKPEQEELIPTWVPVGRFGTPDDIAGCAVFLASDLSAFVTGTTVHADGGSLAAGGWFRSKRGGWTNRPLAP